MRIPEANNANSLINLDYLRTTEKKTQRAQGFDIINNGEPAAAPTKTPDSPHNDPEYADHYAANGLEQMDYYEFEYRQYIGGETEGNNFSNNRKADRLSSFMTKAMELFAQIMDSADGGERRTMKLAALDRALKAETESFVFGWAFEEYPMMAQKDNLEQLSKEEEERHKAEANAAYAEMNKRGADDAHKMLALLIARILAKMVEALTEDFDGSDSDDKSAADQLGSFLRKTNPDMFDAAAKPENEAFKRGSFIIAMLDEFADFGSIVKDWKPEQREKALNMIDTLSQIDSTAIHDEYVAQRLGLRAENDTGVSGNGTTYGEDGRITHNLRPQDIARA
jgi:hypothetical protein